MTKTPTGEHLAARLIVPRPDNFVARPWGGFRMAELKGLAGSAAPVAPAASAAAPATSTGAPGTSAALPGTSTGTPGTSAALPGTSTGAPGTSAAAPRTPHGPGAEPQRQAHAAAAPPIGEAFELAAADDDPEAAAHPSMVPLGDGLEAPLPRLLGQHGDALLGEAFIRRYGRRWPLLPKTLDVVELLSVQGHPPGNTEVYVIMDAEPGATIRVGFAVDVDAAALERELAAGRVKQQALLELGNGAVTAEALQRSLRPWLARRAASVAELAPQLEPLFGGAWPQAVELLRPLHALYWQVLDLMNAIPVAPGQVIYNATPPRLAAKRGGVRSAEVHALGNPEGLEVVALEIRKPGVTFRAWDNVRFPIRDIDVTAALDALNLERTEAAEFVVARRPAAGRPGVAVSVDDEHYRLEHLTPHRELSIDVPASPPHSLHVLAGDVSVYAMDGECIGRLVRGDAALVPNGVGAYRIAADTPAAELLKVSVPV